MEISSPAFMEAGIPLLGSHPSIETSHFNSSDAAVPDSEAFMHHSAPSMQQAAAISWQRFCGMEKSAFTSMETLMPNSSAFLKTPLSHHTSMEPLHELPRHCGLMQTSTALDTGDFSANNANPWTTKKKELSGCRNTLPMSRIENTSSRQVTFCKRRNGLFKKAYELSVLCDAEVGAIIFSPSGKLSEFASSSMSHIIKRYQSFQPQMSSNDLLLRDVERWKREAIFLSDRLKCLQDFQRCMFETNNMPISMSEVQSLELMLERALDKIRKRKMELIEVKTHEIIKKGEILLKENNMLKEKGEIVLNENNLLKGKLVKMMLMKEGASNYSSGRKDLRSEQDVVNTKLQLGLDILHRTLEEENSCSSKN